MLFGILLTPQFILLAAAIIPAIFLLRKVYREDHLDRESPALICSLLLSGIFSTFIALVLERIGTFALSFFFTEKNTLYHFLMFYLVVACSEEGAKYALLEHKTWNHPEFNCQFDGLLYAVTVSLGFALWENIAYVFRFGLGTALVRAITAVPGHACFGVFMGVWYGIAKKYANWGNTFKASIASKLTLLVPILLHGTYDFICSEEEVFGYPGSFVFLVFIILLFLVARRTVRKASINDQFIQ